MNLTDTQAKWFYLLIFPAIIIGSIVNRIFLIGCFCALGATSIYLTIMGE